MTDPTRYPGTGDGEDTGAGPGRGSKPGMPRWVKVPGIIVGVLTLLVVVLALTGVLGGQHGPGRHMPGGNNPGGQTPPVLHGP